MNLSFINALLLITVFLTSSSLTAQEETLEVRAFPYPTRIFEKYCLAPTEGTVNILTPNTGDGARWTEYPAAAIQSLGISLGEKARVFGYSDQDFDDLMILTVDTYQATKKIGKPTATNCQLIYKGDISSGAIRSSLLRLMGGKMGTTAHIGPVVDSVEGWRQWAWSDIASRRRGKWIWDFKPTYIYATVAREYENAVYANVEYKRQIQEPAQHVFSLTIYFREKE